MSKAFTKEDVDPPERSGRVRSSSGLPPGAVNYITARGARRLREELATLTKGNAGDAVARCDELQRLLATVTVVEPASELPESITFGAAVTVRDAAGDLETFRIVGVDEMAFALHAVSWISPLGKILLAAEMGDRVTLDDGRLATICRVDHPED
ncbi:MAG: GreA/GreB family elongation factor [Chthoniobacterales bacterium]